MELSYRLTDKLTAAARNPRTHSDEQIDQLVGSINEFGWTNPILVDEADVIIAGHGRLEAAKRLALDEVPVIQLSGLTEMQKRALAIVDNKLALNAGWDTELLKIELSELVSTDEFDSAVLGFGDAELKKWLNSESEDSSPQLAAELQYSIVVHCDDEMHQGRLLTRLESEGLKCKPLMS